MAKRISDSLTLAVIMYCFLCLMVPQASAELDINEVKKAAYQGDVDAQYTLGVSYAEGLNLPKDEISAYAWSSLAASQGEKLATKHRDSISSKLSPEELHEAQALAAEYQVTIEKQMKQPPSLRFPSSSQPFVANSTDLRSWIHRIKPSAGGKQ